ncbi:hypothetical protein AVEN_169878-1 [Araneus ventricosus]|uniref:Uncharacterized protein n=1 Tax=Araneus ventricosus TaxID=182803 RepID=A0A4Y2LC17_ARAVE|nr:hypothetical protein AVEN_169878-1 [Araneus ventricosus]
MSRPNKGGIDGQPKDFEELNVGIRVAVPWIPIAAPQFQLHKILWGAVSSTAGLHVEGRHHLQSVCLQDVVLVDQTDEKSDWSVLQQPPYTPDFSTVWSTKTTSLRQTFCR